MPLVVAIPLFVLAGVGVACGIYYTVVGVRVALTLRRLPTLRTALPMVEEIPFWPPLCVVVPAHNEEAVIPTLIRSLKAQDYPHLRVVLALDRCTDGTEDVALREIGGDERFEIVKVEDCPEDWAGKVHAVHCGATRSQAAGEAELLLFTDADTWFEPLALRCAVTLLTNRYLDLLSLLPTLTRGRWFERIVQPAAGFELMRRYPLDRLNRTGRIRFANGQFMLFKRDAYEALGGHERVKGELLEDLAFARLITQRKRKRRLGVLLSGGLFHCRMYADWAEFRRGWKRIYTESSHCVPARLRRDARRVRAIGAVLPTLALATLVAGVLVWVLADHDPLGIVLGVAGVYGVAAFAFAAGLIERTQGLPFLSFVVYPIGAWLTGSILREAAADLEAGRKTVWGGREYARPVE